MKKPSLARRLLRLLGYGGKQQPASFTLNEARMTEIHSADDMAFRAGAAVTFVTPIGAYAGSSSQELLRQRAMQQFAHIDNSHNTTIN